MIGHRSKDIRYYQCSTLHSKGSSVCKSNLVYADQAEEYVYKRLEQIAAQPDLLSDILDRVNSKVRDVKRPLQEQLNYINGQIVEKQKNIAKFISMIEKSESPPASMMERISSLEAEKKQLLTRRSEIEQELNIPTIKEVSFERVYYVLNGFSKIITKIEPEKQKDLLHSIISKITVNTGNHPAKRSVKDIVLFFDASLNDEFVLTYGTVHRG
ncbi:hypothetical protein DFQ01_101522 [Paenibacillus cellulosilyticus]|uniref:Recombinase-like zinc beta ribbon protein n=1 Tax=Paenibacillus cellulosilyticus TaxID=375489 RepID=A0A2V2Z3F5_9BACL|nr:zinc ribbon domain-containing protein [Paenibacillus cellulosilyticus]PWW08796.1 hypothetical protein DFQ01_101522 [Paenibacillus cellulosilyticus]